MYSQNKIFHRNIDKIESLIKWIQYVLSLNQIFIFLLKNSIFQGFFLSIRYKSTYRILVLVINDRNEVLTSRPLQQTNHSCEEFSLYWNITSFFSYYDWNKKI